MSKDRAALTAGLILAAVAAVIFLAALRLPLAAEILQAAMLLLGLVSMAAISAFARLLERSSGPLVQITFNEAQARSALEDVVEVSVDKPAVEVPADAPWEPTENSLLLQDPVLALAKLRIDIERELRRIAYTAEPSLDSRRLLAIPSLLQVLVDRKTLSIQVAAVIKNILPVCNQAIHGGEIGRETALSVSNIGTEVLKVLRQTTGGETSESSAHLSNAS